MNFLQIAQSMADRLDRDRPTTIYAADLASLSQVTRRYRDHINLALAMIKLALNRADEYRQTSTTLALVADTESYDIPSGLLNIDQVQIGPDPPLDIMNWIDFETYKRQFLLVTDTGYPQVCTIYQRKIWFYPTPDSSITANIRGQETLSALDADTDTPDLPTEFHRAIVELGIYLEMVYKGHSSAGVLMVNGGMMSAQGGQAATAVNLINLIRNNYGDHIQEAPRMRGRYEAQSKNALRRVIY